MTAPAERPPLRRSTTPPATLSTAEVAELVGMPKQSLYVLARGEGLAIGSTRVAAIIAGRRILWPRRPILVALGLDDAA